MCRACNCTVSGNGGLIAAMVIGWIIAMVALAFALYVYMRDRGILTQLRNDLQRTYLYMTVVLDHYENMPMQYTEIFKLVKNEIFN